MATEQLANSQEVVISVRGVGKLYQLFDDPQDRLKHMLLWRFGKTYGRTFWALRDLSFDLHRGEMMAIIGKNGSGKSTLLQMIAGTLSPTEGSIYCSGRIGALLELGSGFNPEYTGRENIQLNASILGISAEELKGKIQSIIDFADIGEFIDQPVKLYSSGMFVRLAFAVTTGLDCEVLLIDEALAVGDVFFRQKCYQRLEELRSRGVSIILVTHSMGDVEQYCERAILLHHGKELFQGSAPEAVKRYYLVEQEERLGQPMNTTTLPDDPTPFEDHSLAPVGDTFWPSAEAFFDLTHISQVSNGWARCTGVALCDEYGQPCRVFEQGKVADFYCEFELLKEIEVPHGGIEIQNDKSIIVHGKSTIEYGTELPNNIFIGERIRFHHRISLEIQIGEYTFGVGFGALKYSDYLSRYNMTFTDLDSRLARVCLLPKVGAFTVILRKITNGPQLLHHGIANLPGECQVSVIRNGN